MLSSDGGAAGGTVLRIEGEGESLIEREESGGVLAPTVNYLFCCISRALCPRRQQPELPPLHNISRTVAILGEDFSVAVAPGVPNLGTLRFTTHSTSAALSTLIPPEQRYALGCIPRKWLENLSWENAVSAFLLVANVLGLSRHMFGSFLFLLIDAGGLPKDEVAPGWITIPALVVAAYISIPAFILAWGSAKKVTRSWFDRPCQIRIEDKKYGAAVFSGYADCSPQMNEALSDFAVFTRVAAATTLGMLTGAGMAELGLEILNSTFKITLGTLVADPTPYTSALFFFIAVSQSAQYCEKANTLLQKIEDYFENQRLFNTSPTKRLKLSRLKSTIRLVLTAHPEQAQRLLGITSATDPEERTAQRYFCAKMDSHDPVSGDDLLPYSRAETIRNQFKQLLIDLILNKAHEITTAGAVIVSKVEDELNHWELAARRNDHLIEAVKIIAGLHMRLVSMEDTIKAGGADQEEKLHLVNSAYSLLNKITDAMILDASQHNKHRFRASGEHIMSGRNSAASSGGGQATTSSSPSSPELLGGEGGGSMERGSGGSSPQEGFDSWLLEQKPKIERLLNRLENRHGLAEAMEAARPMAIQPRRPFSLIAYNLAEWSTPFNSILVIFAVLALVSNFKGGATQHDRILYGTDEEDVDYTPRNVTYAVASCFALWAMNQLMPNQLVSTWTSFTSQERQLQVRVGDTQPQTKELKLGDAFWGAVLGMLPSLYLTIAATQSNDGGIGQKLYQAAAVLALVTIQLGTKATTPVLEAAGKVPRPGTTEGVEIFEYMKEYLRLRLEVVKLVNLLPQGQKQTCFALISHLPDTHFRSKGTVEDAIQLLLYRIDELRRFQGHVGKKLRLRRNGAGRSATSCCASRSAMRAQGQERVTPLFEDNEPLASIVMRGKHFSVSGDGYGAISRPVSSQPATAGATASSELPRARSRSLDSGLGPQRSRSPSAPVTDADSGTTLTVADLAPAGVTLTTSTTSSAAWAVARAPSPASSSTDEAAPEGRLLGQLQTAQTRYVKALTEAKSGRDKVWNTCTRNITCHALNPDNAVEPIFDEGTSIESAITSTIEMLDKASVDLEHFVREAEDIYQAEANNPFYNAAYSISQYFNAPAGRPEKGRATCDDPSTWLPCCPARRREDTAWEQAEQLCCETTRTAFFGFQLNRRPVEEEILIPPVDD